MTAIKLGIVGVGKIATDQHLPAIAANGEDATRTIEEHCALIGHVHASEPGLVVLGDGGAPHAAAGAALRAPLLSALRAE